MSKKAEALLIYAVAYISAIIAAGVSIKYLFTYESVLLNIFLADLVGSLIIFLNCIAFNSFSLYDPYWTVQCTCITIYYYLIKPENFDTRTIIACILVNIWSIRLTCNLFISSVEDISHEDWRYSGFRSKTYNRIGYLLFGLLSFILVPTVVVYVGCLPIYYALESTNELNSVDILAIYVTLVGIYFEGMADYQLRKELEKNNSKTGKLACMDKGLWSLCRHPNYFGEITFWHGLYIFGLSSGAYVIDSKENYFYLWVYLLGPFAIFVLIYFGSMPLMEERQIKRRAEFFKDYMRRVPFKILPLSFLYGSNKSKSKVQRKPTNLNTRKAD